jgi:hypothetical protein
MESDNNAAKREGRHLGIRHWERRLRRADGVGLVGDADHPMKKAAVTGDVERMAVAPADFEKIAPSAWCRLQDSNL